MHLQQTVYYLHGQHGMAILFVDIICLSAHLAPTCKWHERFHIHWIRQQPAYLIQYNIFMDPIVSFLTTYLRQKIINQSVAAQKRNFFSKNSFLLKFKRPEDTIILFKKHFHHLCQYLFSINYWLSPSIHN